MSYIYIYFFIIYLVFFFSFQLLNFLNITQIESIFLKLDNYQAKISTIYKINFLKLIIILLNLENSQKPYQIVLFLPIKKIYL